MQVQILVGQHVDESLAFLQFGAGALRSRESRLQAFVAFENRQAVKPAPDSCLRPFLQPDRAIVRACEQEPQRQGTAFYLARLDWIRLGLALALRGANLAQRA